ncbi:dynein light chain 1, axonemal-like [Teleopsis dalmanni]|uniref:dynein light chain 1, axonemal-like n=1 Tax=Teleopsis dalmanni TaxID=139649 RepID=UPI0018CEA27A|nr:dynein light chain 1, axonemal-like [Teleopsis dalmanni]XP_037941487.1 dynein light chain 1, axonemal-like [Teleopsis dalmanni]
MFRPTSVKTAITAWELKNNIPAAQAVEMGLQFQWPPIERMDASLAELVKCRKLSLSTNMIDRITGINSLTNLKILKLSRNKIRSLNGIEFLAYTLEELSVSYNYIEQLKPIDTMKALKVFHVANNLVSDWTNFDLMAAPPLEFMSFLGNPLEESLSDEIYKAEVKKRLPNLKYLDGDPIV